MKVTIEIPAHLAAHLDATQLFDALDEWIGDADVIAEAAQEAAEEKMVGDETGDRHLDDDEQEEFAEALAEQIRMAMGASLCVDQAAA